MSIINKYYYNSFDLNQKINKFMYNQLLVECAEQLLSRILNQVQDDACFVIWLLSSILNQVQDDACFVIPCLTRNLVYRLIVVQLYKRGVVKVFTDRKENLILANRVFKC